MLGQANRFRLMVGWSVILALLAVALLPGCKKKSAVEDAASAPAPQRTKNAAKTGAPASPNEPTLPGRPAPAKAATPAEQEVAKLLAEAAKTAGVQEDNPVFVALKTALASPLADMTVKALRKYPADRAKLVAAAARGMKAGVLSPEDKAAIKAIVKKAGPVPGAGATPAEVLKSGLPAYTDVQKQAKIEQFASLYGPVVWYQEKNWDATVIEWVTLRYEGSNLKLPLALIMDAPRLKLLEPYFRIYPNTGFGKVLSKRQIVAPRGLRELVLAEDRKLAAAPPPPPPTTTTTTTSTPSASGRMGGRGGMGGMMRP